MEATKEPQRGRELGGHDGDDGDDDDLVGMMLARLTLGGQLTGACATARLHGMEFDEIRDAFNGQLALLVTAEDAISSNVTKEAAIKKIEDLGAAMKHNAYQTEDGKKNRS